MGGARGGTKTLGYLYRKEDKMRFILYFMPGKISEMNTWNTNHIHVRKKQGWWENHSNHDPKCRKTKVKDWQDWFLKQEKINLQTI